jgi:hypothetical protein
MKMQPAVERVGVFADVKEPKFFEIGDAIA